METPLPYGTGYMAPESSHQTAFEQTHKVEQRVFDIEHEEVDVVWHDTVAEDTPLFGV